VVLEGYGSLVGGGGGGGCGVGPEDIIQILQSQIQHLSEPTFFIYLKKRPYVSLTDFTSKFRRLQRA